MRVRSNKVFTTRQTAKICHVASATVCRWFDSGLLKGFLVPGSQDRRIPRLNLIEFLKENEMPLDAIEEADIAKVLLVSQDQVLIKYLRRELTPQNFFSVGVAASGFEAGIQTERFRPDGIVIDCSFGEIEAWQICQNLRSDSELANTLLIALLPDDGSAISLETGISEIFKKPFDAALLIERIKSLIGAKKEFT